jgi:uncharacterized membrane protein YedE/YeeE
MLNMLLHVSGAGSDAGWIIIFCAGIISAFAIYAGVALRATLHASDPEQRKVCYQAFRDLLDLFRRGRDR